MIPTDNPPPARPPRRTGWSLPYVVVGVAAVYLLSAAARMGPPKAPFDLDAFARLPVVEGGRVKPLEATARDYLRVVSGQEEYVDENGTKQPAIRWFAACMAARGPDEADPAWKLKVFRVDNEQLLAELRLEPRQGLRYSLDEMKPRLAGLFQKAGAAEEKREAGKKLDLTETKTVDLARHVTLALNLAKFKGYDTPRSRLLLLPPRSAGAEWRSLGDLREEARGGSMRRLMADPRFGRERVSKMTPAEQDALVAEAEAAIAQATAALDAADPAAAAWPKFAAAYRDKKYDEFNTAVGEYRNTAFDHVPGRDLARANAEAAYLRFAPFYYLTGFYVLVVVLGAVSFVMAAAEKPGWQEAFRRSATWLLVFTLVLHTAALLVRMYLMDRPLVFVTNLYSSAVFIGWGCVAIGLVLERVYPLGIGNTVAAVLGLATTIVAHNLGTEDTLEVKQAVLDTNFWLATHVTTVTLGYTATFVAGFIGVVYVMMTLAGVVRNSFLDPRPPSAGGLFAFGAAAAGLPAVPLFLLWFLRSAVVKFEYVPAGVADLAFYAAVAAGAVYAAALILTRASADPARAGTVPGIARPAAAMALTPDVGKVLAQMVYGVVCFATLLSFVGTVLGGIWADQSWGRFWGWDPKENGAVLIVLWNALILHARWAGLVKARGVAVLAVAGNMVTAWSWFGTNQLGIGLHAYGFDTRLADGCTNFWLSQLVVIGLGLIPRRYWEPTPIRPAETRREPVAAVATNGHHNGHPSGKRKAGRRR
ncbi:MAG: cytochrome c biogenesis protein CcsA [Gemmataceae bacterium]|nr:cytochrome c biogenesis protein CcsA [Gemmataceae bacterium]